MRRFLRCYAVTAAVFLGLDAIWLSLIGPVYRDAIGELMREEPRWSVAAIFYGLFAIGLVVFAVHPARSPAGATVRGGLFGAFTYGTFEMTSLALLAGWPVWLAGVDILWGTFVCAAASFAGYAAR